MVNATTTPRSRLLAMNKATNDLYYRLTNRPHHFEHYCRLVRQAVADTDTVVHLGSGKVWLGDICNAPLAGKKVYAVDPDPETLAQNPAQDRICASGEAIPLESGSVGAVVCEYVVEHLTNPIEVLQEIHRILAPGGRFIFVTPNAWSYSAIVTRLTPQSFHNHFLAKLLATGGSTNDKPYPTQFRMNTRSAIQRIAAVAGLRVREIHSGVDHPTYTYPFPVLHQIATAWHLILDKVDLLDPLRITWVVVLEKT